VAKKLPDPVWAKYQGVLGHFHIQDNKIDPGPAFQWDLLITGARNQPP
jgi:N-acetyl-anhydromuramyl-L-alanine amidase AmpD